MAKKKGMKYTSGSNTRSSKSKNRAVSAEVPGADSGRGKTPSEMKMPENRPGGTGYRRG